MEFENEYNDFISRTNNFHGNFDPLTSHDESYYQELQGLCEQIDVDIDKFGLGKKDTLEMIFSRVYNFVIYFNSDYAVFGKDARIYADVFKAGLFTTLCSFLYDTKRIKGLSLREFIYAHSPLQYNVKGSPNYFDYKYTSRESEKSTGINSEDARLRKYRQRFLSERPVYNESTEWSAIRKVSEHEWSLYYILEDADADIRDTFKRIKNLYHEIYTAIYSTPDDEYTDRLVSAYNKFYSKLKKIKYENVLSLYKYCLDHICKDKTCYGINLFRFENELRAYTTTAEIKDLLKCSNTYQKNYVLQKSILMNGITFPKLYKYFGELTDYTRIAYYTQTFLQFCDDLVIAGRLAIDKFVEYGSLGEDWANLFLKTINDMAEDVLYNPKEIDYSVTSSSHEMFIIDISTPVYAEITALIEVIDSA